MQRPPPRRLAQATIEGNLSNLMGPNWHAKNFGGHMQKVEGQLRGGGRNLHVRRKGTPLGPSAEEGRYIAQWADGRQRWQNCISLPVRGASYSRKAVYYRGRGDKGGHWPELCVYCAVQLAPDISRNAVVTLFLTHAYPSQGCF